MPKDQSKNAALTWPTDYRILCELARAARANGSLDAFIDVALQWAREADAKLSGGDTARLNWLLPNLHPANFGLEFPGGYEWSGEAEFLRKWRAAIDAELPGSASNAGVPDAGNTAGGGVT